MLETIIVVLVILWLLGYFGGRKRWRGARSGNLIHLLLVIALVLLILRLLR